MKQLIKKAIDLELLNVTFSKSINLNSEWEVTFTNNCQVIRTDVSNEYLIEIGMERAYHSVGGGSYYVEDDFAPNGDGYIQGKMEVYYKPKMVPNVKKLINDFPTLICNQTFIKQQVVLEEKEKEKEINNIFGLSCFNNPVVNFENDDNINAHIIFKTEKERDIKKWELKDLYKTFKKNISNIPDEDWTDNTFSLEWYKVFNYEYKSYKSC